MGTSRIPGMQHAGKPLALGSSGDQSYATAMVKLDGQGNVIGESPIQFAGASGGITNTSDVPIAAAAGAGIRNYLTAIQFKNTAAVASEIVVKDGSTVIWRGHVSASMTFLDGAVFNPPLRGSANTAMNVALLTTATATIVSAQGYTGAN